PEFRRRYDEVDNAPAVIASREAQRQVLTTINTTLNEAIEQGLPTEIGEQILKDVGEGKFDTDAQGNKVSTADALSAFTAHTMTAIRKHATQVPPKEEETKTSPKVVRDDASPDMRSGDRNSSKSQGKFTAEEVRQMTPLERLEHWPNDGDWEAAIRAGDISGIESNTFSEVGT
ncbi:hypothetical protein LCGC14_3133660, partial [marine sediment metagenome]